MRLFYNGDTQDLEPNIPMLFGICFMVKGRWVDNTKCASRCYLDMFSIQ